MEYFIAMIFNQGWFLPLRGHLVRSRDICGCHNVELYVTVISWMERGQGYCWTHIKYYPAPNVTSGWEALLYNNDNEHGLGQPGAIWKKLTNLVLCKISQTYKRTSCLLPFVQSPNDRQSDLMLFKVKLGVTMGGNKRNEAQWRLLEAGDDLPLIWVLATPAYSCWENFMLYSCDLCAFSVCYIWIQSSKVKSPPPSLYPSVLFRPHELCTEHLLLPLPCSSSR